MKRKAMKALVLAGNLMLIGCGCFSIHTVYASDDNNRGYEVTEEYDDCETCDEDSEAGSGLEGGSASGTGDASGSSSENTGISESTGEQTNSGTAGSDANSSQSAETVSSSGGSVSVTGRSSGAASYSLNRNHQLDKTPKTADVAVAPRYVLCAGIFMTGLSIVFFQREKGRKVVEFS